MFSEFISYMFFGRVCVCFLFFFFCKLVSCEYIDGEKKEKSVLLRCIIELITKTLEIGERV